MKLSHITMALSLCTFIATQAMHVFIGKERDFEYTFNGAYDAAYARKTTLSASEAIQLEQFENKITLLSNSIKRTLATLFADNANVVSAFPKEGPSAEVILKIMMSKIPSSSEYSVSHTYETKYTSKKDPSVIEQNQLSQFRKECETIALNGSKQLLAIFTEGSDVIAFKEHTPTVELRIKLFMNLS